MMSHPKGLENNGKSSFHCRRKVIPFLLLLLFLPIGLFEGSEAAAQQYLAQPANTQKEAAAAKDDFLFRKPTGFLGLRFGRSVPWANSDIYEMVADELTIEKTDFQAWDLGFDCGFSLSRRLELVFSLDTSERTIDSEFRDWVDEEGMPITQQTIYSQAPFTAGLRFLLVPRGREVGKFAWLPSRIVPYISGGGGVLWYDFRQEGYFVDASTLEIFPATFETSGSVPTVYVGAGIDIRLYGSAYLTLDIRHSWASHEMEGDFVGFEPIDLSGLLLTAGFSWHF